MSADSGAVPAAVRRVVDVAVRLPLGAVVAIAVCVRLLAGVAFSAGGTDEYEFGWLARNVVEGRGYSYFHDPGGRLDPTATDPVDGMFPSAYMPPAYTSLVMVAAEVDDSHAGTVWVTRLFNVAAAAAGVALVDALARRLVGRPGARLAALGFALYPAFVYGATQVSAANLYLPVELGLLLLLVRAATSTSAWRYAAAGLVMGALCLLRAEAVALVPLAAAWLAWSARSGGRRGGSLPRVAVFAAVALVLPGAWIVRNSLALGAPVATVTTTGGMNLWVGNHEGASGSQKNTPVTPEIERRILELAPGDDYELRRDAIFRDEALDYLAGDPLGAVARDVKKAGLLLVADVHDRRNLNPAYLGSYAVLAVAGSLGFVRWWRRRPGDDTVRWLIAGYLAASVAVPIVFFTLARYRLPVEMVLLVFAGAWLADRCGLVADRGSTAPGGDADTLGSMSPEPRVAPQVRA